MIEYTNSFDQKNMNLICKKCDKAIGIGAKYYVCWIHYETYHKTCGGLNEKEAEIAL